MTHAPLLPVARWIDPQAPLYYVYPVSRLRLGASLGNPWSFARADTQSNLLGLWASEDQWYCGRLRIQASTEAHPLTPVWTVLTPHSQATVYHGPGVVVTKEIWVPFGTSHDRAVVWFVEASAGGPDPVPLHLRLDVLWPPILGEEEGIKRAEPVQREKRVKSRLEDGAVVAVTVDPNGRPLPESRILGAYPAELKPVSVYFGRPGTVRLVYQLRLEPGESRRMAFVLVHTPQGEAAARQMWAEIPPPEELYERTVEALQALLRRPVLLTPSPVINRGFEWAKVNTLRTQSRYPAGYGFTNDPPQDILVVRDAAWYLFGNDFFTPEFSREMIELVLREGMEPHGKLTEFIRCAEQPPSREDYGLNINDDTPLFLLALYHHAAAAQDMAFLRRIYPRLRRAANYITSQMQDDLVVCESRGTNVHGIASWRNIIPAYNLTGAVTEINAECCAALRKAAEIARALGYPGDARAWEEAAGRLAAAINERLVSPNTGLYMLARTEEGEPIEAVTADIVFPVLFDAAPEPLRRRVMERLLDPGIWTPYGARTVPSDDPDYDPEAGYQLLGGVWPNLTAWIAYGARRDDPGRVAEALEIIYRISEAEVPAAWGYVVPGQFPERLHGETGVSRGMTLSPWMPPTYLWLAISGLMGVEPILEGLKLEPAPPPGWQWMVLRDLPFAGSRVSMVWWRGTVYTSVPVKAAGPTEVYQRDLAPELRVMAPLPTISDALTGLEGTERVVRSPEGRVGAAAFSAGEEVMVFVVREAMRDPGAGQEGVPGAGAAVAVTWARADGERLLWQGSLLPGEAVRVRVHAPTLRIMEEERVMTPTPVAVPQPAA